MTLGRHESPFTFTTVIPTIHLAPVRPDTPSSSLHWLFHLVLTYTASLTPISTHLRSSMHSLHCFSLRTLFSHPLQTLPNSTASGQLSKPNSFCPAFSLQVLLFFYRSCSFSPLPPHLFHSFVPSTLRPFHLSSIAQENDYKE